MLSSCSLLSKLTDGLFSGLLDDPSSEQSSENNNSSEKTSSEEDDTSNEKREWTLFFYICGSNLESGYDPDYGTVNPSQAGYASLDIEEIMSVNNQPADVNIVLECGGAAAWNRSDIQSHVNKLSRWHIKNNQLIHDKDVDKASMGVSNTLSSFLDWGIQNYPAEKYGLFMWNHGGALSGCCFDENYDNDSLTANEVDAAMTSVKSSRKLEKNFEFITYDACLMALQEVAQVNAKHFNYMLSSQETEMGSGYDYDAWLPTLYANPTTVSAQTILAKIASTFIAEQDESAQAWNLQYGCEDNPSDQNYWPYDQTQSVFDLTKMSAYKTAFESFAQGLSGIIYSFSKWSSFKTLVTGSSVKSYGEGDFDIYNLKGTQSLLTAMKGSSTYSGISSQITALESAVTNVVVYEEHQKETVGCGMCIAVPVNGNITEDEFTSQVSYQYWTAMCTQYGSFYSGGWGF